MVPSVAPAPAPAPAKTAGPAVLPYPAPAPRPPAAATASAAKTSDMNACWGLMCDLCGKMPKAQLEQEWFAAVGIVEGKDQADMSPEEWGRVEEFILAKYGSGGVPRPVGGAVGRSDGPAVAADADDVPF